MPGTALDAATVTILVADFVSIDADGHVTLVGAGTRVLAVEGTSWHSRPFGVWATIAVTERAAHAAIVELVLAGRDGESVRVSDGAGGSKEVRFTQPVVFHTRLPGGIVVPEGELPLTYDIAVTFASGLVLEPDKSYRWQLELDGRVAGDYAFFVAASEDVQTE